MKGKFFIQEIIYQLSVFFRQIRYSRWFAGPRHHEIARTNLRRFFIDLNGFLRDQGVDYWLAYGTLLGYHREQDLILGDIDIDIGLPEAAYPQLLQAIKLVPPGLRLIDSDQKKHGGPKMYLASGLLKADLYFYADKGDSLKLHLRSHYVADSTPVPRKLILPTREINFLGQPTRAPNQVEALLKWTYGYIGRDGRLDRRTGFWIEAKSPTQRTG